jgi:hypothetical protein
VGLSKLGTSEAVTIGAYAFALRQLDASGTNPCRGAIKSGKVCAIKSGMMLPPHCQLDIIR